MRQEDTLVMQFIFKEDSYNGEPYYNLYVSFGYLYVDQNTKSKHCYGFSRSSVDDNSNLGELIIHRYSLKQYDILNPIFDQQYPSKLEVFYDIHYASIKSEMLALMCKQIKQIEGFIDKTHKIIQAEVNGLIDSQLSYYARILAAVATKLNVTHLCFSDTKRNSEDKFYLSDNKKSAIISQWLANSLDTFYHKSNKWDKVLRYTNAPLDYELDLPEVESIQNFSASLTIPRYRGILIPVETLEQMHKIYEEAGQELLSEAALRLKLNKLPEPHLFYLNSDRVSLAEAKFREHIATLTKYKVLAVGGWKSYGCYNLLQLVTFQSGSHKVQCLVSAYFSTFANRNNKEVVRIFIHNQSIN